MRSLINIATFSLTMFVVMISCKKEKVLPNQPPIAKAKPDTSIQLSSCGSTTGLVLDGTSSFDPDGHIVAYRWRQIGGPGVTIMDPTSSIAIIEHMGVGDYVFELLVKDAEDLVSEDTIKINVFSSPTEYNLDISFNARFTFTDNFEDCGWDYSYPCISYDFAEIKGTGTFPPLGELNLYGAEHADSANLSNSVHDDELRIYSGDGDTELASGICSVDFIKLIREGGGVFAGNLSLTWGSAYYCDRIAYKNLSPLVIAGSLDLTTRAVILRIKGKIYF